MKEIDRMTLFRLSVLGPLVSRDRLVRGELQQLIRELALRTYDIPGARRNLIGEKTIEAWYYAWRKHGVAAPRPRSIQDGGGTTGRRAGRQAREPAPFDPPDPAPDGGCGHLSARNRVALGHLPPALAARAVAGESEHQSARGAPALRGRGQGKARTPTNMSMRVQHQIRESMRGGATRLVHLFGP